MNPPNLSDDLATCDGCGVEAMHDLLHWDDSLLIYRCHYCQQRHLEKVMVEMEAQVLSDDNAESNSTPRPSPCSQSKPQKPLAPADEAEVVGR